MSDAGRVSDARACASRRNIGREGEGMGSGRIFFILECLMPASCSLQLFIAGYFPNGGSSRREFCSWFFFSLFLSLEKEKIDGYRVDSLDIMDYLLIVIVYIIGWKFRIFGDGGKSFGNLSIRIINGIF